MLCVSGKIKTDEKLNAIMLPANRPINVSEIDVVAPNLKRRLSGVTTTVIRLVPIQSANFGVVATGPGLPPEVPHIPLLRAATMPRKRWRVWHARRNTEMIMGLLLRHVLRRRYRLLFTSAAQRDHKPFTKWLIQKMDRIVATSPQAASFIQRPATVIMHGVNSQTFHPAADKSAVRRELGLPDGLLIGCFGRVRHQKGIDVLVDAALEFLPENPDVSIIITGRTTADQQAFLNAQIEKLKLAGLQDRVLFKGEVPWEHLVKYYQSMDLFTAPARWEGFGLTPIEAMACGVPTVATRAGTFEEQIIEGQTGMIVQQGDVNELRDAIKTMIADRASLATMGVAARQRVLEAFRIETEAAKLIEIYRDMLDMPPHNPDVHEGSQ